MKSAQSKTATAFYSGIREGAEKRAYGLQIAGAALGALAGSQVRSKKRYDQGLADYTAMVRGNMSPREYERRKMERHKEVLRNSLIGLGLGTLGGHAVKTVAIPKLQEAYGNVKNELGNVAEVVGRRAVEASKDPAREVARAVAKEVVDEAEERIKRHASGIRIPTPRPPKIVSDLARFFRE